MYETPDRAVNEKEPNKVRARSVSVYGTILTKLVEYYYTPFHSYLVPEKRERRKKPRTLYPYGYVGNNPMRYTDPTGQVGSEGLEEAFFSRL